MIVRSFNTKGLRYRLPFFEISCDLVFNGPTPLVFTEYDRVIRYRRPRKMITLNIQRLMLRRFGYCMEGDASRVPEHVLTYQTWKYGTCDKFLNRLMEFRWERRGYRASSSAVSVEVDIRCINARFK